MRYAIAIKVFEPANRFELPIRVPFKALDENSNLKLGYHVVDTDLTHDEFEYFMDWARKNESILKVIGSEKVYG